MYASLAARLCALYAAGVLLSGCLFTDRLLLEYIDSDNDGYFEAGFPGSRTWDEGTDCDDNDPAINQGQPELCGDGIDNDCNEQIDESGVGDIVVYADVDKDGFGNPNNNREACTPDADWVTNDDDCDDQNNTLNPLMEEACDGLDNDCDGVVDDNAPQTPWYEDLDGDSFGTPVRVELSCQPPAGFVPDPGDCDDGDASVFPGADDVPYDGVDADCASDSDYDLDRDGYLHAASATAAPDCDDDDPSIHPGSVEVWYDGVDQDCDPLTEWDQDRDGFEVIPHGTDCDDLNPLRRPGAPETWYDGVDQDCDPATEWDQDGDGVTATGAPTGTANDCDDRLPERLGPRSWYADADWDGWGDPGVQVEACTQPPGYVARPGDCNDTSAIVHPEAPETCLPGDEDCDGLVNEDGGDMWYPDLDGDGHGDALDVGTQTCTPPRRSSPLHDDCDDLNDEVHPGAPEVCDGLDNDCDLANDIIGVRELRVLLYRDADGDGVGDASESFRGCMGARPGWVTTPGDCDDTRAAVFPGAAEPCDGIDNNCVDDLLDEGRAWYWPDVDGDGFGAATPVDACPGDLGAGWVTEAGDCLPDDPAVHPAALEICDHLDNDCVDGVDRVGGRDLYVPRYADEDGDAVGAGPIEPVCPGEPGYAVSNGDCDDADPARFPGNPEVCDGVDNNCAEDLRDEGRLDYWQDADGDGFGAGAAQNACPGALDATWVNNARDCDDADAAIRPGAREECDYDDNNCNGMSDELALRLPHWGDQDGDSWGGPPAPEPACDLPNDRLVRRSGDCDDNDEAAYPGAPELCDEVDQSCDGRVDDDGRQTWYYDGDGDGIGGDVPPGPLPVYPPTVCEELLPYPERWTQRRGDCNDADPSIRPGVAERCDRIDSNCNGWADEPTTPHFPDRDGDLAGQQGVPSEQHCAGEPGWVENQRDCDDTDPNRRLGAPELCDEVDQDCDGDVRDDGRQVWYYDGDRDGYGVTLAGQSPRDVCVSLLTVPSQWSNRGGDCDDRSRSIHPTAVDPCDEVDQDCDGNPYEEVLTAATIDVDHDGYGDPNTASVDMCANQICRLLDPVLGIVDDNAHPNDACWVPTVSNPQMHDCNDDDADVHPNAEETCDGKRNSCDPCTDIDPVCAGATRFEWEGSVYQVKLDRSDPRTVLVETETWADGAAWCHGRGYKMWWPTQRLLVLFTWQMEPWVLAQGGYLYYANRTIYHTGIRAGCPDGTEPPGPPGTTTSVWSLWDGTEGAVEECVLLSATSQSQLGLGAPASAASVAQITLVPDLVTGLPRSTSVVAADTSYGTTVCELDGPNLLPAENPACLAP